MILHQVTVGDLARAQAGEKFAQDAFRMLDTGELPSDMTRRLALIPHKSKLHTTKAADDLTVLTFEDADAVGEDRYRLYVPAGVVRKSVLHK